MADFNSAEEQHELGPVPAGSLVVVRMSVEMPRGSQTLVTASKTGMLGLWCKYEVDAGRYKGCQWFENLWLPASEQTIKLTDGQKKACNIAGARIRAILEASRGIMPSDKSAKACEKRQIKDWGELTGRRFPVRVGIDGTPRQTRGGDAYWVNRITAVITPDKPEYASMRAGKEYITDGPVCGEMTRSSGAYGGAAAAPAQSAGGTAADFGAMPSEEPYAYQDDVPF